MEFPCEPLNRRIRGALTLGHIDPWQIAQMLHSDVQEVIDLCKIYLLTGEIELAEWHKYPDGTVLPAFRIAEIQN